MASKRRTRELIKEAFHEVKHNPPRIVKKTKRKSGSVAARKQSIAIALSKARKAGAKVKGKRK